MLRCERFYFTRILAILIHIAIPNDAVQAIRVSCYLFLQKLNFFIVIRQTFLVKAKWTRVQKSIWSIYVFSIFIIRGLCETLLSVLEFWRDPWSYCAQWKVFSLFFFLCTHVEHAYSICYNSTRQIGVVNFSKPFNLYASSHWNNSIFIIIWKCASKVKI